MSRRLLVVVATGFAVLAMALSGTRSTVAAQGGTGTIVGHIHLTGAAPPLPRIRMGADPVCASLNRGKRPVQEIVVKGAGDGLANAFVHVEGTFRGAPAPAGPVEIDQNDCFYRPRVIGAQVGQVLEIKNDDPTAHNVHSLSTEGNAFNSSQPVKGLVFKYTLKHDELMLRIKCDIHSWMVAYVGVMPNPYYAVSDGSGAFRITGVPAGKHTVQVWHELYGPMTETVDVKAGGTVTADFAYTGKERPAKADIEDLVIPAGTTHVELLAAR